MNYHVEFDIAFKRNPYKGVYIVVEGIDASGKTTQVAALQQYFEKQGKSVVLVQEPSREGHIGDLIHRILQAEISVPSVALQYLYSADRTVTHYTKVIPALQKEKIVISSRCFWSVIPYGILDREATDYNDTGKFLLISQGLLSHYHRFIMPDYTFYLDISVSEAMQRIKQMGKQTEIYEERDKLEKIAIGYNWLIKKFPKEFIIINGEQPVEEVTKVILSRLPK